MIVRDFWRYSKALISAVRVVGDGVHPFVFAVVVYFRHILFMSYCVLLSGFSDRFTKSFPLNFFFYLTIHFRSAGSYAHSESSEDRGAESKTNRVILLESPSFLG